MAPLVVPLQWGFILVECLNPLQHILRRTMHSILKTKLMSSLKRLNEQQHSQMAIIDDAVIPGRCADEGERSCLSDPKQKRVWLFGVAPGIVIRLSRCLPARQKKDCGHDSIVLKQQKGNQ
eukprot:scaffold262339_cov17-Prasinocladus_malaysianus.AAC.1